MKDDREFVKQYKERKLQLSVSVFEKRFPEIFKEINDYELMNKLNSGSFQQKIYNWLYELTTNPKCPITNEELMFDRSLFKYKTYRGRGIRSDESQKQISLKRSASLDLKNFYEMKRNVLPIEITFHELKLLLETEFLPITNFGGFTTKFISKYPELYSYIQTDKFLPDCESYSEKIYRVINNMEEYPLCSYDSVSKCNFKGFTKGYSEYGKNYRLARKIKLQESLNSIEDLYNQNEIKEKISNMITHLKDGGMSDQNIYQCFASRDLKLVKSILEHTKKFQNIKFSNRVFILLNGSPIVDKTYIKPVFSSLEKGYDMRFENSRGKSKPEREILDWIIQFIPDVVSTNRTELDGKEIDIYSDSYKIGIEYDGIYWHNYDIVGKDAMINKKMLAKNKGINLLHIFETEWLHKQDIVKSLILSKFGIFETKIYARKCNIKEVAAKDANLFLEQNHLQGKDNSKIKFGLYLDDELVSIMTFGTRKITGSTDMELIRFCNKINTTVIGGASKLFKHFIKIHNPQKIKSYANLRVSDGGLYHKLGFELKNQSAPNYWYFKSSSPKKLELKHRSGYQKHRLISILENFDPNKTEWENMKDHGYKKIYDCGNLVFEYSNPVNKQ